MWVAQFCSPRPVFLLQTQAACTTSITPASCAHRQHAHGGGEVVEVLQYMQQEATTLGDLLGHPRDPAGQAAVLASFLAAALRGESSHHLHAGTGLCSGSGVNAGAQWLKLLYILGPAACCGSCAVWMTGQPVGL